jgi:predicted NBD/HSP70 family sugar kinase
VILGVSIDGLHARGVLVNDAGAVVGRADAPGANPDGAIAEAVRATLASSLDTVPDAAGISFPDPDPGSWPSGFSSLAKVIGSGVSVKPIGTGNATALAEVWYGAGRGVRDLIAFSVGPCVCAGVVSNGALLAGAHGLAASVAWLALNPVERDDYRRLGCLEAEAGSAGIVRRLVWRIKSGDRSRVMDAAGGDYARIQLDDILTAARDGDGVSISVIRDTVKYLAMAVSNMAAVIDPDVIVLGGILESAGDLLLDPIRQECARRMPPSIQERVKIVASTLGADAAPMGAARFAISGTSLPLS